MNHIKNDDFIGKRFNHWTVIGTHYNSERKETEWVCRCDCGKVVVQRVWNVKNGKTKQCYDCLKRKRKKIEKPKKQIEKISYIGNKYGQLTVLDDYYEPKKKCRMFKCKCDCGNVCVIRRYEVLNGKKTHCGNRIHISCSKNDNKKYIGEKYGELTVVDFEYDTNEQVFSWVCRCSCGGIRVVKPYRLRNGSVTMCKDCAKKAMSENNKTHGLSYTRLYSIWGGIKERCNNSNSAAYKYYGERGISICEEWRNDFTSFYEWSMNNGYEEGLTIDRIDNDGNYEPSNCRWTTMSVQANNKRKVKPRIYLTIDGINKPLKEWGEESEFSLQAIKYRLDVKKMTPKDAVFGERTSYKKVAEKKKKIKEPFTIPQ